MMHDPFVYHLRFSITPTDFTLRGLPPTDKCIAICSSAADGQSHATLTLILVDLIQDLNSQPATLQFV